LPFRSLFCIRILLEYSFIFSLFAGAQEKVVKTFFNSGEFSQTKIIFCSYPGKN
jgi:hypothetical protein